MLVEEIFKERIIPFHEPLWRNERSHPGAESFLLGITAAAMLFPRDYAAFATYLAKELRRQVRDGEDNLSALKELLTADGPWLPRGNVWGLPQHAMRDMPSMEAAFHDKVVVFDQKNSEWQRELFGSPATFLEYVSQRGFSENGKGSLAERIMRGRICGQICLFMAASGKSLKESIDLTIPHLEEWRKESEEIQNVLPSLDHGNIENNIWPKFKDIAWLWSGFNIECPIHNAQHMLLEETDFYLTPITKAMEVTRLGWRGFMDFGIKIFNRLYGQPPQFRDKEKDLPWRFSFQVPKNDDSSSNSSGKH